MDAVVIGASAGGVDAIGALLTALPATFAPAVLVVLHIPADRESLLIAVLGPRCALRVCEAADKQQIVPGNVYIAPPGYHLLVEPDATLALSLDAPVHYSRPSIDVLFESAAYAFHERVIGIVLTGANADGAQGLAAIRQMGGQAWVQAPETAYASVMPQSALEHAGADWTGALSDMAALLAAL
ncbi:MAG: chemotaxis protein CheB [Pseudomonadota bacterium]